LFLGCDPDADLLFASLSVPAAIAFALLTQLNSLQACVAHILALLVPRPLSATVVADMDAARPNLNTLRKRRNGKTKSRRGDDGKYIRAH
jgi:hypothetical protein